MKWKDTDDDTGGASDDGDLSFDGSTFSLKKDDEDGDLRPNLFKKNMTPMVVIGAGALLLVLLFFVIFSGPRKETDRGIYETVDTRIKQLENKITELDSEGKQTVVVLRRLEALVQAKIKRLDMLETSIAKKLNDMAKEQESLKQPPVQPPPKKPPSSKQATRVESQPQLKFHEVKAGENLYRIGLRYNLKVSELRRLNNLGPDAVLKPGQKLVVSPAKGP